MKDLINLTNYEKYQNIQVIQHINKTIWNFIIAFSLFKFIVTEIHIFDVIFTCGNFKL